MNTWIKEFDVREFEARLPELGVEGGCILYLAGSTAALPKSEHLYDVILDGFVRAVGEQGTIVMPTFSFEFCDRAFFDPKSSDTYCGRLSTAFLRRNDVCRTWYPPIHTVAVVGTHKQHLLSLRPTTGFSAGSAFDWMVSMPTLICLFGVSVADGMAHIHWLEEKFRVGYRKLRKFTGVVRIDGSDIRQTFSRYVRVQGVVPSAVGASLAFEESAVIRTAIIGSVRIKTFGLSAYIEFMTSRFESDLDFLI